MNSKQFNKLLVECTEEWSRKVGTRDIVLAAKDVFTNPTKLYSHSNPLESVKSKYDRDVSSRRGNYAEKVVFMVIRNDPRFKFLRECINEEEIQLKELYSINNIFFVMFFLLIDVIIGIVFVINPKQNKKGENDICK